MLGDPLSFLQTLLEALHNDSVDVDQFELDHLCYRVQSEARYHEVKELLACNGTLLGEHMIAGRPIATFRLNVPFRHGDRMIDVIELPAPKIGSPYEEGFEHAEFVIDEDLLLFTQRHPRPLWDLSDLDKPINADVRIRYEGFSVKFHRRSLTEVIQQEQDARGDR